MLDCNLLHLDGQVDLLQATRNLGDIRLSLCGNSLNITTTNFAVCLITVPVLPPCNEWVDMTVTQLLIAKSVGLSESGDCRLCALLDLFVCDIIEIEDCLL